jgi:hypothetical protein
MGNQLTIAFKSLWCPSLFQVIKCTSELPERSPDSHPVASIFVYVLPVFYVLLGIVLLRFERLLGRYSVQIVPIWRILAHKMKQNDPNCPVLWVKRLSEGLTTL